MIKFIATLLVGGSLLAADLPDVDPDECSLVAVTVEAETPTYINPDPAASAVSMVLYCGHQVQGVSSSGATTIRTERAFKVLELDAEQAEVIVQAAEDLLGGGEVYLP